MHNEVFLAHLGVGNRLRLLSFVVVDVELADLGIGTDVLTWHQRVQRMIFTGPVNHINHEALFRLVLNVKENSLILGICLREGTLGHIHYLFLSSRFGSTSSGLLSASLFFGLLFWWTSDHRWS